MKKKNITFSFHNKQSHEVRKIFMFVYIFIEWQKNNKYI